MAITEDQKRQIASGLLDQPNELNHLLMLKNGGMDPAIVQVDTMKWPQSDCADDVKE